MSVTAAQLMVKVSADTRDAERGMKQVQQQAKGLGGALGGIGKLAAGVFTGLSAVTIAKAAFGAAKTAVVDFNAAMEQSAIAWKTMLGSAEASEAMLGKLQQFAKETPFDFPELEQASRRLLAMGFGAEEVIPLMTDLGNAASALGLGTEGVNRLGLALGQMRAKTKVSGEEMRQLTEAGVPAWEILAQAVGKSIPEVMKLASEGKIAASTFIQAFQTFSQQNYGGMMEAQSQTFKGAMSNIRDALTQGAASAFQPLFAKLSEGAQRIADFVSSARFDEFVSKVRALVSGALDLIERLSAGWQTFMGSIGEVTDTAGGEIQQVWHTVVGWFAEQLPKIQEIVQTVLGSVRQLWEDYGQRIVEEVKIRWGAMKNMIRWVMASIGEGIDMALALLKGDWQGAWESYKQILVNNWSAMITYLAGAAKSMLNIIGGIYQALGKDDPTAKWAAKIDDWAASMVSAAEKALGVEESLHQASGAAATWADYAEKGKEITEEWERSWQNLGREAPRGMGDLRSAEAAVVAGAQSAASSFDLMGGAADDAGKKVGDLAAALVRIHPASVAATQAVAGWEAQIAGVNAAIEGNQRAQRNMQKALDATKSKIALLNDRLTEAKNRLQELATPRLTGMGAMDMQIQALQDHLKRVELADTLGKPLAEIMRQYPLLTAGAEAFIRTLQPGEKALREQLQALELMRSLQFDERLRLLQQQAAPAVGETTYEAAMAGISATQAEIADLTAAMGAQEAKAKRQEAALAKLREQAEGLNDALRGYQANLAAAQAAQDLVNQGLELAYNWFLRDRQAMLELGAEGVLQAGIVDEQARKLLEGVNQFATDTTNRSTATMAGLVDSFQTAASRARVAATKELKKLEDLKLTVKINVDAVGGGLPGRAAGGPVYSGQPYIVGEQGPELFVPRVSGTIVPAARTPNSGAAGPMTVHVHVAGSVIAERDLAATVYEELQRLRRRNGAVGLA